MNKSSNVYCFMFFAVFEIYIYIYIFLTILGNLILYDYKLVHQIDLLREHFQLYTQFPRNIIVS